MFETKLIVAPNSPNARANASTQPAAMPRSDSGSVIVAKRRHAPAPSVSAAASRRRSTLSNATRIDSTSSGNPMTAAAIDRAGPAEREHDADLGEQLSERRIAAEQGEQRVAGHDRRQDQRQEQQRLDQQPSGEALAREQPCEPERDRQRRRR